MSEFFQSLMIEENAISFEKKKQKQKQKQTSKNQESTVLGDLE